MEIAAFASLAVKSNDYAGITDMRESLGESPREWFERRGFVRLGFGDALERFGVPRNWKVSALFNELYDLTGGSGSLEGCINAEAARAGVTPERYMVGMCKRLGLGAGYVAVRLLLLSLSRADGLGKSVWDIPSPELRCPLTEDVRRYIDTFFPCHGDYGDYDDCVPLFGFDDVDFFYSVLAYTEMRLKDPSVFKRYETFYRRKFDSMGCSQRRKQWGEALPPVSI
jgi:hypothetical protein